MKKEELIELKDLIKKDFLSRFKKETNDRGYFNWTQWDDILVDIAIRSTDWKLSKLNKNENEKKNN